MGFAKQMFTSNKKDWTTPLSILERVRKVGPIGLDPCDNKMSIVKPRVSLRHPDRDGLNEPWKEHVKRGELVFINWPYGNKENKLWAQKVVDEVNNGCEVTALVAVRTSEIWFQDIILNAGPAAIAFCHKRLRFSNAKAVATFSSMVVYFGQRVEKFKEAFKDMCAIWVKPKRGEYPIGFAKRKVDGKGKAKAKPATKKPVIKVKAKAKVVAKKPVVRVKAKPAVKAKPTAARPTVRVKPPVLAKAAKPTVPVVAKPSNGAGAPVRFGIKRVAVKPVVVPPKAEVTEG